MCLEDQYSMRPWLNGWHFASNIFKCIFLIKLFTWATHCNNNPRRRNTGEIKEYRIYTNFLQMFSFIKKLKCIEKREGMTHWWLPHFVMTHEMCSTCSTYGNALVNVVCISHNIHVSMFLSCKSSCNEFNTREIKRKYTTKTVKGTFFMSQPIR